MVELVDTSDLKSDDHTVVRVQVPLRVQNGRLSIDSLPFVFIHSNKLIFLNKIIFYLTSV